MSFSKQNQNWTLDSQPSLYPRFRFYTYIAIFCFKSFGQFINFQIVFTGLAVLLVDKFGRRPLFAISALVQSIAIIVLGIFFKLDKDNLADDINWLPLVNISE